ncbi:LOW QUALITY PROTEIN: promotilin [Theristicus caerulescens]
MGNLPASHIFETPVMVSKKVVASLLLPVVAVLAEQTEGFVPFFTQSDFWKTQEKERNKGGQEKSLQQEEESFSEQPSADVNEAKAIQLAVPVKAGMWLAPRQLEKYQDVLGKLLAEMLQDTPDADWYLQNQKRKQCSWMKLKDSTYVNEICKRD